MGAAPGAGAGPAAEAGSGPGPKAHDHRPRFPALFAPRLVLAPAEGATSVQAIMARQGRAANQRGVHLAVLRRKQAGRGRWRLQVGLLAAALTPPYSIGMELSTEAIHSTCGAPQCRAACQLAGRAASMVGRPGRRSSGPPAGGVPAALVKSTGRGPTKWPAAA